jgi:GH18 family chitinase
LARKSFAKTSLDHMNINCFMQKAFVLLLFSCFFIHAFSQTRVVGYFPTWENFPNAINTMALNRLTYIDIAFANPDGSGNVIVSGATNANVTTVVTKAHSSNVKVCLSIGGAGAPGANYTAALGNASSMTNFINNLVQYTLTYNLDGIDVDIEGDVLDGTQVTAAQYESFVTQLATALHAQGKVMSAALADWFGSFVTNTAAAQYDFIGIMSYDGAIPGTGDLPGPHASYDMMLTDYAYWHITKGVLASKINMGVPFYGYGWGTYSQYSAGVNYATIVANYPGAQNTDSIGSDPNAIYYNGIPTIQAKTAYSSQNGSGIMIWELGQDATGSTSLLTAIAQEDTAYLNKPLTESAYTTLTIPGQILAADYDYGPAGVAYSDADLGNNGGVGRVLSDVDMEACSEGGYDIGWIDAAEWLNYTVNVTTAGTYTLQARVTSPNTGDNFYVELDGVNISGTIAVPNTGGYQAWQTVSVTTPALTTGTHTLKIVMGTGGFNLEYLNFNSLTTSSSTPYLGVPAVIPGTIEAENYDLGGEGIAYHDSDAANDGGEYRLTEGVDIEATTDTGGGYDVGWTANGEWMKYSVNVTQPGAYTLQARVATQNSGDHFHVEIDGVNVSGTIVVPNTGGWQNWQTVSVTTPALTTGVHTMRIVMDQGGFNLNYLNWSVNSITDCPNASISFVAATPISGNTYQWQVNSGTGYTNISNGAFYTGVTGDTLVITNAASSLYGNIYQCAITKNATTTYCQAYTLQFADTWTGATSTAWETGANWSCGGVPDSHTDVIINVGTVVLSSTTSIRSLSVNSTVHVTLNSGSHLTILH